MPRNRLQPCFTSLTETSLHEPLTDHKIVCAALGTVTVRSTVGSTARTLEVLTESPDTFFLRVPYVYYILIHVRTCMYTSILHYFTYVRRSNSAKVPIATCNC